MTKSTRTVNVEERKKFRRKTLGVPLSPSESPELKWAWWIIENNPWTSYVVYHNHTTAMRVRTGTCYIDDGKRFVCVECGASVTSEEVIDFLNSGKDFA